MENTVDLKLTLSIDGGLIVDEYTMHIIFAGDGADSKDTITKVIQLTNGIQGIQLTKGIQRDTSGRNKHKLFNEGDFKLGDYHIKVEIDKSLKYQAGEPMKKVKVKITSEEIFIEGKKMDISLQ